LFGAPEYVHDFMQTLRFIDNVYINGVNKKCTDQEYPSSSKEDHVDFEIVTMTFVDKVELTEKRPCSATADVGCSVNGYGTGFSGTGGLTWGGGVANKAEAINGLILTYNG